MPGLSVDVVSAPATLFWRLSRIWSVGEFAKTARAPPVPMLKFACGAGALRIWSRIFCEIAVMLCVVKRLAAAMSSLWTPATNAEFSASISALRYAFVAVLGLAEVEVVSEGRRVERLAAGVVDAARDDEQIRRVLVQLLGALGVQRIR